GRPSSARLPLSRTDISSQTPGRFAAILQRRCTKPLVLHAVRPQLDLGLEHATCRPLNKSSHQNKKIKCVVSFSNDSFAASFIGSDLNTKVAQQNPRFFLT